MGRPLGVGMSVGMGRVGGDRRGRRQDEAAGLDALGADQVVGQLADQLGRARGAGSPPGSGARRDGRAWS